MSVERIQIRVLSDLVPNYAKKLMKCKQVDECLVHSSQLITDIGLAVGLQLHAASASAEFKEVTTLMHVKQLHTKKKTIHDKLWYKFGVTNSAEELNEVESLLTKLTEDMDSATLRLNKTCAEGMEQLDQFENSEQVSKLFFKP